MSLIVIKAIQQNERIQEGQCDCYARQQFVFHLLSHHNSIPISCRLGFIKKGSKNKMIMFSIPNCGEKHNALTIRTNLAKIPPFLNRKGGAFLCV